MDETDELTDELVQVAPNMEAGGHVEPGRGGAKPGVEPESCARSIEWLSSWCVKKGIST